MTITARAATVSRRPASETNRPATGALIAEPTAKGMIASPASSGESPSDSCRWIEITSSSPVNPVK